MRRITAAILGIITALTLFLTVYLEYLETGWAIGAGLFSVLFFYGFWKAMLDITKLSKALHRPIHMFEGIIFGFAVYSLYALKMAKVKGFELQSYLIVMGVALLLEFFLSLTERPDKESCWFAYFVGTLLYTGSGLLLLEFPKLVFNIEILAPYQDIAVMAILVLGAVRLIKVTFFRGKRIRDDDYYADDNDEEETDELYYIEEDDDADYEGEYIEDHRQSPKASSEFSFFADCSTIEELDARYKNLCRTYHPDSKGGNDSVFKAMCEEYGVARAKLM